MLSTPTNLQKITEAVQNSREARIDLAEKSLGYFATIYFSHYFKNNVPQFHHDMYELLADENVKRLEVIAFRGSAKSTIVSLIYPIWCSVFKKKHFIILCSDTHSQAKQIITNLIFELEHNDKLVRDFGTFKDPKEDWTATNIHLKNDIRIMSRSRGQKFRGLRHLQHRPDLIILDDIENIDDVRTKEQRDKTEEWYASDVVPTLDTEVGRLVVVGNMLHSDSIVSRIKNKWRSDNSGIVKEYPLINDDGENVWISRYPFERVDELKKANMRFFQREYLLKIVASDDQIVKRVGYYETLPTLHRIAIGVDLAIGEKDTNDYTSIAVVGEAPDSKMYVIKNPYGRWDFNKTMEHVYGVYQDMLARYPNATITLGIEDVAYQKSAIQEFYRRYKIQPIPIKQTQDKRARLETLAPYIENDNILFPKEGCDDMLNQLFNFGVERYDDCIDSLEIATRQIISSVRQEILYV